MALTLEDLQQLGTFLDGRIEAKLAGLGTGPVSNMPRENIVGAPDVEPDSGPQFYVHLADGSVVTTFDSASTHLPGKNGKPVVVIGRYQVGA